MSAFHLAALVILAIAMVLVVWFVAKE